MKVNVVNLEGKEVGSVELNDAIFARKWNADLVHQVALAFLANQRQPWAHAKGRGEVAGGGKKPWKQKGTGRARHGSIRSPIWRKGGASHGPVKERDYSQKINKKMLRAAMHCVLSKKVADGELKVVDSLALKNIKTKEAAKGLKNVLAAKKGFYTTLVIPSVASRSVLRAFRNINKVDPRVAGALNIQDLLSHKHIVVEKAALTEIK